jgi:multiple sugar transport system substrate-binding protein
VHALRPIAAALACLLLGGCLKPPPPHGTTRIQFFYMGWPTDLRANQPIVDEFERENPGIKVDMTLVNPGNYSERMQTLIVGGIVPDVMSVDINNYYEWADRGMLADLTDVMDGAEREQKMHFMPIVPDQLRYHGRYYCVPYNMCGVILEVNLELFRKAGIRIPPPEGVTWDWIAGIAPRLARRSGNPNAPAEIFCSMPDMASLLFTFGGRIFDDDQNPHKVLVRSPEVEEMCRFVRRIVATKAVISRAEITTGSNLSLDTLFFTGGAAARIMGLWSRPGQYGVPAAFQWDVLPFPAGPRGERVTANGAFTLGVNPKSAHLDAAKKLVRFYLNPKGILINGRYGDYIPLFREMTKWPQAMPHAPAHIGYFVDTLESGACRFPVHGPGVAELRRVIDSRLDQVSAEPDVPIPVILQTLEDEIYHWLEREKEDGFYR